MRSLTHTFIRGFRSLGQIAGTAFVFIALIAVAAVAITAPLWLLSTRLPQAYAIGVATILGLGIAGLAVNRILRIARDPTRRGVWQEVARPAMLFLAKTVVVLLVVYGTLTSFLLGQTAVAIAGAVVTVALLAFLLGRRRGA